MIFFEYIVILMIYSNYQYYCCICCINDDISLATNDDGECPDIEIAHYGELESIYNYERASMSKALSRNPSLQFENTYESFTPGLKYLLFVTRFLSFCYLCGISVIANYNLHGTDQWFYFSSWNSKLLAFFFLFAIISSVIGFIGEAGYYQSSQDIEIGNNLSTRLKWSQNTINFGHLTHILFEICGGTASLITAVAFGFNQNFAFWNVSVHFVTIVTMIIELCLNNMYVRADHLIFSITWSLLYLIFIWPIVVCEVIPMYPYPFLTTESYYSFFIYTLLAVADVISYMIFYGLSLLKLRIRFIYHCV